jgi:uncharacterized protein
VSHCIIVFAKEPIPNRVKTRLLPALSPEQAASLYKAFLVDWCATLSKLETADLVIAYTPPEGKSALQTLIGEDAIYIPQVGADLGERLGNAGQWACEQKYQKFLFVGSDSPTLPIQYVKEAFKQLESCDVVVGPSMDGGYYLIGFSADGAELVIPSIFEGISWSSEVVFRQTLEKLQSANARLGLLPPWYDVDTPAELQFLRDHLLGMRLAGETGETPQIDSALAELGMGES